MHGKIGILIVAELLILVDDSRAFSRKLNISALLRNTFQPRCHEEGCFSDEVPTKKDIAYLPEDDYVEDYQEKDDDGLQQLERESRNLLPDYRNLCEIVTKKVRLDDSEYEYQPPYYYEVFCKDFSAQNQRTKKTLRQKCAHPGFHCVQRSRTLFLLKRRWESDCWEPFTKVIASGCDCMWPVSILGDITPHF